MQNEHKIITFEQFIKLWNDSFNHALAKKPLDLQEKIKSAEASLFTTIRIEIPSHLIIGAKEESLFHMTLFFLKAASPEKVYELWETISKMQWSGEFVIKEDTSVQQFGPSKTRPGELRGLIAESHLTSFTEGVKAGTVVPEMPKEQQKEEMKGYYFTPHISGFTQEGQIVIPTTGLKIQLKFLGPVDPMIEFTI